MKTFVCVMMVLFALDALLAIAALGKGEYPYQRTAKMGALNAGCSVLVFCWAAYLIGKHIDQ